jgi:phosphohistidine phosphatase
MNRLILFRHGEAERPSATQQDIERALNAHGREETRAVAAELARLKVVPELALVSAAERTRQTWAEMAPIFPAAVAEIDPSLYDAGPETLLDASQRPDADTVMVVGHNPGVHQLALYLAQNGEADLRRRLERNFPTGGAAVFVFDAKNRARCEAVVFPKDVR